MENKEKKEFVNEIASLKKKNKKLKLQNTIMLIYIFLVFIVVAYNYFIP